jgi:hypothetical protein
MNNLRSRLTLPRLIACAVIAAAAAPSAWAVPSYARQTGMACSTCHTVFPELTPFGREFKLNGYVLDNMKQIKGITMERSESLSLNSIPPLSLMAQISYTHLSQAMPDAVIANKPGSASDANFPQQLSLFYAGKIADGLGAFIQLTYDGVGDHFGMDNTDIRYAQHFNFGAADSDLVAGLTLNNNPTVQDPWNSTPAWGFPYEGSATAPGPAAGTQIDGALGTAVAGLTAYAWYNHSLYGEAGVYTGAKVGDVHPVDSTALAPSVRGLAPYWRLAYEARWDQNSLSVGTYGIHVAEVPAGQPVNGPTDKFTDYAFDSQYQYITDDHQLTVLGTFIHEHQSLDASSLVAGSNASDSLNSTKLTAIYYWRRKVGAAVGFFNTNGSNDPGLYAPTSVVGSANGSPNSRGYAFEVNYVPFLNVKLQMQYVAYSKFNGGGGNYDGSGRNASDNNTLYLLGWFNF